VILAKEYHNWLMGYEIKYTLQFFEKILNSQQPKSEFQNKLFNKILYPIRNSELMIPNRCAHGFWDKLLIDTPRPDLLELWVRPRALFDTLEFERPSRDVMLKPSFLK
jgi:hypothetical protein